MLTFPAQERYERRHQQRHHQRLAQHTGVVHMSGVAQMAVVLHMVCTVRANHFRLSAVLMMVGISHRHAHHIKDKQQS